MQLKIFGKQKNIQTVLLMSLVIMGTACGSRYNTIDQKDLNAESEYVYGNIGGPPKQAANQYEADEAAANRANAIRIKMFGDTQGAESGLQQGNPGQ